MKIFWSYVAGIVIGCVIYGVVANKLKDFKAGDLGLGIATTSHEMLWDSVLVNQVGGDYDAIVPVIHQFQQAGNQTVLLTGNSQLHAINYYRPGDNLAVYRLNEFARAGEKKLRFVQLSSPNINFKEILIYYLALRQEHIRPDWLVVGATYRCFQSASLRPSFLSHLGKIKFPVDGLSPEVSTLLAAEIGPAEKKSGNAKAMTDQQKIESYLTEQTEQHWKPYAYRGNVQAAIKVLPGMGYRRFLSDKNFYRGSESVEALNMSLLTQLLTLCKHDNVKVLIYQPPHPQSEEPFQYDRNNYNGVFESLKNMADEKNVYFRNFEATVPLGEWGADASGRLDIFHFKNQGHLLLADDIYNFIKSH